MYRAVAFIVLTMVLAAVPACTRKGHTPAQKINVPEGGSVEVREEPQGSSVVAAANRRQVEGQEDKKAAQDLHRLHLEVTALEVIWQLQMTRPQLERLAKLAPTTAGKEQADDSQQGSDELHKAMTDLRAALLAEDEDRIADLSAKLEDLRDKEHLDAPEVEITEQARGHTRAFLRSLGARQVTLYLADYAQDFPDPVEKLSEAIDEVRDTKGKDADRLCEDVAEQVGWLVAGLDAPKARATAGRARALLTRARRLSDADFQKQHEQLEKAAREVVGEVEPTDVIRHFLERTLAELLSNPRLQAAVTARLKQRK